MRRGLGALVRSRPAAHLRGGALRPHALRPQQLRWLGSDDGKSKSTSKSTSTSTSGFGKFETADGPGGTTGTASAAAAADAGAGADAAAAPVRTRSPASSAAGKSVSVTSSGSSKVKVEENSAAEGGAGSYGVGKGRALSPVTKKPAKNDPHLRSGQAGLTVARQQTDQHYASRGKRKPGVKDYTWIKQKSPFKRAAALITELNLEEMVAIEKKRAIPNFRSGDAVQVSYAVSTESPKVVTVRGLVIGRRNALLNSTFRLKCVIGPDPVEFIFPLYSPLMREILVIDKAYLHRGKKRVRRSKLYYVDKRPVALYTVNDAAVRRMYFRMDQNGSETDEARARILGVSMDDLGGKLIPPPEDEKTQAQAQADSDSEAPQAPPA